MRLWHKDLIPILPRKQLLGQWRECCLIAKNIAETGSPNHILVNRIMDYPTTHFSFYSGLVYNEMMKRGYKCDPMKFKKYLPLGYCGTPQYNELFSNWHNERYYWQCYFNLMEKYDCGGISPHEWDEIEKAGGNIK